MFRRLALLLLLTRALSAQNTILPVETFAGPDLSARIIAADASLGPRPGTLIVDAPGTLASPLTLHRGHNLLLRAPITWTQPITLEGANTLACSGPAARITVALPPFHYPDTTAGVLLLAHAAAAITVRGCTFTSAQTTMLFAGLPVTGLTLDGNTLNGLSLAVATAGPSTGLRFTGNTVTFPPTRRSDIAAISLFSARDVVATGNHFTRTLHGIQWWGGDSAAPTANLDQVTTTGDMRLTDNTCADVTSCIWGSMGFGITISGNVAVTCADVCFDTEGGRDTEISFNTASACANGCAAVFFFTRNTVIRANHFSGMSPGGGLILIKNASADPLRHAGLDISGNTLECTPGPCRAIYAEAAGALHFDRNHILNGTVFSVNYARAVTVAGNDLRFTVPLPAGAAAIAAPAILGGTTLLIGGNRITSEAPQPPNTACIASSWSDFNATDLHILAGNSCAGSHPFPVGIATTTDGKNPGPHALWILAGNTAAGPQPTTHRAATANETYRELPACTQHPCTPSTPPHKATCTSANFGQLAPTTNGMKTAVCANGDIGQPLWIPIPATTP